MSKVEFVKNEKENEPRILVFVDGIKINTLIKNSEVVLEYTCAATISGLFHELINSIKTQTGLSVTHNEIHDAYEQYKKENK